MRFQSQIYCLGYSQLQNKIYAAAENAIFSYDEISQELNTITTVQGL